MRHPYGILNISPQVKKQSQLDMSYGSRKWDDVKESLVETTI